MTVRVLFVCMGNICRSPLAEGVFRAEVMVAGLDGQIEADSAGTGSWHVGARPDPRALEAAGARGIDISRQRARQVTPEDFHNQDLILAMDRANLTILQSLAPAAFAFIIIDFNGDCMLPNC